MQALTAIAATAYAIGLWMFAPETRWQKEVETAKRNQQTRLTPSPEMTPQPKPETIDTSETELKSITKDIPESTPQLDVTPEATEEPITETEEPTPQPEPETVPTPEPITEIEEPTPQPESEPESISEAIEQAIQSSSGNDYAGWTTTQLRELAKQRKLQWRPLINGKRTPLKKPDLIKLLTA